jgi:16S rRNA (cytosine967-C5)-methyltransferase
LIAPGDTTVRKRTEPRTAPTPARKVAVEVLADVRGGQLLDIAFNQRAASLDPRERRWVHELTYGVMRHRAALDAALGERVRGGLTRLDVDLVDVLRAGAYQLLHMNSVPSYAAIAQTVELTKQRNGLGAGKLVNAVMRRLDRERNEPPGPVRGDHLDQLALQHSHPRWLVKRWVGRFGVAQAAALLAVNNTEPPLYVRPYNITLEQLESSLEMEGAAPAESPLVRDSLVLAGGVPLTELSAFSSGELFVQDPGATLVTRYAAIPQNVLVADVCAAPGGKALELSRTNPLIASDRSAARLGRLVENVRRVGATNIQMLVMDVRVRAVGQFDAVLLDAPCSGTGTFRRHPDARWRLRSADIAAMSASQRQLIDAAAGLVRPGGLLVYSTCSIDPEENDQVVDSFLATHADFMLDPPPAGTLPAGVLDHGRLRVLPHVHGTDGSFAVRLRRGRVQA